MISAKDLQMSPMDGQLNASPSPSPRSECYKNKDKNTKELRRRRSDTVIELRKQKRDDNIDKRRNLCLYEYWSDEEHLDDEDKGDNNANINEIILAIKVTDVCQLSAKSIRQLRRVITKGHKSNSEEDLELLSQVMANDMMSKLVDTLKRMECPIAIVHEVVALLAQLCSRGKDQIIPLINAGIVENLLSLLSYDDFGVIEESILALTHIWDATQETQDMINNTNFLNIMIALIDSETAVSPSKYVQIDSRLSLVRTISWSLFIMCQKRSLHCYTLAMALLPHFMKLLKYLDDEVRANVLRALSSTTEPLVTISSTESLPNLDLIHSVVGNASLFELIIDNLLSKKDENILYGIRIVGNIVSWGESYTQIVLQTRVLNTFVTLLQHNNQTIQREVAFTVSNITAGNHCQIQAVIDAKIIPGIVELLYMGDYRTQMEACHVLLNISAKGSAQQIGYIINIDNSISNLDSIDAMATLLTSVDAKTIETTLRFYNNLLSFAKHTGILNQLVDKCEASSALYHIEELQNYKNTGVAVLATHLIDTYFSKDLSLEEDMIFNTSLEDDKNFLF